MDAIDAFSERIHRAARALKSLEQDRSRLSAQVTELKGEVRQLQRAAKENEKLKRERDAIKIRLERIQTRLERVLSGQGVVEPDHVGGGRG